MSTPGNQPTSWEAEHPAAEIKPEGWWASMARWFTEDTDLLDKLQREVVRLTAKDLAMGRIVEGCPRCREQARRI